MKRFRVLTLQALGQGMADAAVAYRYETAARPKGLQWEDWMARTETRIHAAFDDLEANWMDSAAGGECRRHRGGRHARLHRFPPAGPSAGATAARSLAHWHEAFSGRDSMVKTALAAK